jgi:hypothetical protein
VVFVPPTVLPEPFAECPELEAQAEAQCPPGAQHDNCMMDVGETCDLAKWVEDAWNSSCPAGKYQDAVGQASCLTVCSDTQFEYQAAGPYHDRVCADHTVCQGGQWAQWETHAAGTHHDRECAACTICRYDEIEIGMCRARSDRECQARDIY